MLNLNQGLKPRVSTMDDVPVDDWVRHKHIIFVVSTAGQGEFPTNARESWKHLSSLSPDASSETGPNWSSVNFSVMALGDSHYWPLPEDAHYFCKSGKDLDAKLGALGAVRVVPVGLGDDRHADGYMTVYKTWVKDVWAALGVEGIEVDDGSAASAAPSDDG